MIYPKKTVSFLRKIDIFFENISSILSYFILATIHYSQYLLSRVIISLNVFQGNWQELKKFKKNETVSIFGNGPSLRNHSFESANKTDIFTCNFFNRHPNAVNLNSTFHFATDGIDSYTAKESIDEILSHSSEAYLVHYSWKNFLNKPDKVLFYFVPSILTIAKWRRRKLFNSHPLPAPINSVHLALMLAILLKYKKIYLYGVDEDQLSNSKIQENAHFYEEDKASAQGTSGVITSAYHERIKSKYLSMIGYKNLRSIADYYGIEIINKNKNSFVDLFKFK